LDRTTNAVSQIVLKLIRKKKRKKRLLWRWEFQNYSNQWNQDLV